MGKMSRTKGAAYERQCAQALFEELGIGFRRNLTQYQEAEHGDLVPDDRSFPFLIECKRYASGKSCRGVWQQQAATAAQKAGKFPAVVFRFDGQPTHVSVPVRALLAPLDTDAGDGWADMPLAAFCALSREMMARASEAEK